MTNFKSALLVVGILFSFSGSSHAEISPWTHDISLDIYKAEISILQTPENQMRIDGAAEIDIMNSNSKLKLSQDMWSIKADITLYKRPNEVNFKEEVRIPVYIKIHSIGISRFTPSIIENQKISIFSGSLAKLYISDILGRYKGLRVGGEIKFLGGGTVSVAANSHGILLSDLQGVFEGWGIDASFIEIDIEPRDMNYDELETLMKTKLNVVNK